MELGYTGLPRCNNPLCRVGKQIIIGVEKDNDLSPARCEPRVECRGLAAILLEYQDDSAPVAGGNFPRVVGGAVIHQNDLDMRIRLSQGAVYRLAQNRP
jgi:hypothetical protein